MRPSWNAGDGRPGWLDDDVGGAGFDGGEGMASIVFGEER